jgi:hypothetical protein
MVAAVTPGRGGLAEHEHERLYPLWTAYKSLQDARRAIRAARTDALTAAMRLDGARALDSRELADKLADALAHVERLGFIVRGDLAELEGAKGASL